MNSTTVILGSYLFIYKRQISHFQFSHQPKINGINVLIHGWRKWPLTNHSPR